MARCDHVQEVLNEAERPGSGPRSRELMKALVHAAQCPQCSAGRDLAALVPHEAAQRLLVSHVRAHPRSATLPPEEALARLHVNVCDACALAAGAIVAGMAGATTRTDSRGLDAIFEQVAAEFLAEDEVIVRRRAGGMLRRRQVLTPATVSALARAAPSPHDYRHVALASSPSLCSGPTSSFARLVREISPYLMAHQPHLYIFEGSFRLLMQCGLLRGYPLDRLHCLAPGRLGGLINLGSGLIGGSSLAGLDGVFGVDADEIAEQLDLNWTIDCVVYLIDPLDATSSMAETMALQCECGVIGTPFLDTYTSAVEFFGLLNSSDSGAEHHVPADVLDPLGYAGFPHRVLGLIADDPNREALLEFACENLGFLARFSQRIASGATAALLNGAIPHEIDDPALNRSRARLARALEQAGIAQPWVVDLAVERGGGNLQIAESVSMGVCDCVLLLDERRGGDQLVLRSARISNHPDRLAGVGRQMLLHDRRSASVWAELWGECAEGGPVTLVTAFREQFGVELVLADRGAGGRRESIAREAAWYLLSALAMQPAATRGGGEPRRVTVAGGAAIMEVVKHVNDVALELCQRIDQHRTRREGLVEQCMARFPQHAARIAQLAQRRRLTLKASPDNAALWSIGSVTVAPIVGRFGSADDGLEATTIAGHLAKSIRADRLMLDASAFTMSATSPPSELTRHWATTDVALISCADLSTSWFPESPVQLHPNMYEDLRAGGAVGEIAGLYLAPDGQEILPGEYRRNGMSLSNLDRIADGGSSSSVILVTSPSGYQDDMAERHAQTVLAALRAGLVSAVVMDHAFAASVFREQLRRTNHLGDAATTSY
jgi:methylglyoxal synthase